MSKVLVTESYLNNIAEAIRAKNGEATTYRPGDMAAAIQALDTSGIHPTGTKQITQNGTHDVTQYASANVNVQPNLQSKTATENGTVTPDQGYDGLSSVVVNVSGGGIPLLSEAAWDALTTAQKQAYGLVAIQNANSGYKRGLLVNGADYVPLGIYLPYSDPDMIICEAYPSIYNSALTEWGHGNNPILFTASGSVQNADGSVTILTKTDGVLAYVDLGNPSTPFTAYVVGKVRSANSDYTRLLSAVYSRSTGYGILLYGGTTISVSAWGSDTSVGIRSTDYFVGVIQFGGSRNALGGATNTSASTPTLATKTPNAAGRYITIGRTDINASTSNAEPTDMDILFLGVTLDVESQATIIQNMQYLAAHFIEGGDN